MSYQNTDAMLEVLELS